MFYLELETHCVEPVVQLPEIKKYIKYINIL